MTRAGRVMVGTLAVVVALALSACGKSVTSGTGGGGSAAGTPAEKVYQQLNALPADQQRAKAIEQAKKEGTLELYTSLTDDLVASVKEAFEQQTGVKMNVFRAASETVLQRTLQESSANRTGNDAIETNFGEMGLLSKQGVLADYRGASFGSVPESGRFPGWLADRLNIMLPAWNTKLIKAGQEPRSWEDLADPRFKGKLTLELTDSDWYENVTKSWLRHGKTQAQVDDLWQKMVANENVAKGHTVMAELLGAGQTAVDGMNYSYITQKGAKHPAAAWLFNDWMLNEGQKLLVSLGLTPSAKIPGDTSLQGVTLEPYDVQGLTQDSKTWDDRYDRLLRGLKQIGGD